MKETDHQGFIPNRNVKQAQSRRDSPCKGITAGFAFDHIAAVGMV